MKSFSIFLLKISFLLIFILMSDRVFVGGSSVSPCWSGSSPSSFSEYLCKVSTYPNNAINGGGSGQYQAEYLAPGKCLHYSRLNYGLSWHSPSQCYQAGMRCPYEGSPEYWQMMDNTELSCGAGETSRTCRYGASVKVCSECEADHFGYACLAKTACSEHGTPVNPGGINVTDANYKTSMEDPLAYACQCDAGWWGRDCSSPTSSSATPAEVCMVISNVDAPFDVQLALRFEEDNTTPASWQSPAFQPPRKGLSQMFCFDSSSLTMDVDQAIPGLEVISSASPVSPSAASSYDLLVWAHANNKVYSTRVELNAVTLTSSNDQAMGSHPLQDGDASPASTTPDLGYWVFVQSSKYAKQTRASDDPVRLSTDGGVSHVTLPFIPAAGEGKLFKITANNELQPGQPITIYMSAKGDAMVHYSSLEAHSIVIAKLGAISVSHSPQPHSIRAGGVPWASSILPPISD